MYHICDIHSHFLPGMDDGCKTVEESLSVLHASYAAGVRQMIATPHYYAGESADAFLQRRRVSEQTLRMHFGQDSQIPEFCCGAEVAYYSDIGIDSDLGKLCLGSSRYLLLELPTTPWHSELYRNLQNLCTRGFLPILAHLERYFSCQSAQALAQLQGLDLLVQINGAYLLDFWRRPKALALLRSGAVQFLASDCHNNSARPQNLDRVVQIAKRKGLNAVLRQIETFGAELFREAAGK